MNKEIFSNISKIIERDSKSTTYKFALLRGTIDLIQENSPFLEFKDGRVHFPTGLLIEKWMVYYFPIFDSLHRIPQINGVANLAFETLLIKVVNYYKKKNRLSGFYNDLKRNGIPQELAPTIKSLANKLHSTLIRMPMHYIGRSISSDYHSIYRPEKPKNVSRGERIDSEFLVSNYGTFSIPKEYYDAFQILGSFIGGQDSILIKWAEFSVSASGNELPIERVLGNLMESPVSERDVNNSKTLFQTLLKEHGETACVWTGRMTNRIEVDHIIPFAIWKNNDLWNLLPAVPSVNNSKRDKIPTPRLIENQKDLILHYWDILDEKHHLRFQKELKISLLGNEQSTMWRKLAINQMKESCRFLIEQRGFDPWEP
ncbi:HNH endonuclease domain-containing protein [Algoriphagus limi]|uniref:HNH nuclease domain-containing protein n=1 Tax=Algoriphagus limi TaxID=2975273 RepID=A0ABT2G5T3_9BACT|nr:HNH endonuclease domain-containing protein [Algoriphagus limi]MCS5490636.1 hypothetical protein [Algoriphagus limi]